MKAYAGEFKELPKEMQERLKPILAAFNWFGGSFVDGCDWEKHGKDEWDFSFKTDRSYAFVNAAADGPILLDLFRYPLVHGDSPFASALKQDPSQASEWLKGQLAFLHGARQSEPEESLVQGRLW